MDISSLSLSNSKPFQYLPLSNSHKRSLQTPVSVSCRARNKLAGDEDEATINNGSSNNNNFYEILSLSSMNATIEEIKRAYRTVALRYHPDGCRNPSMKEECGRIFVQLNTAYETLKNPKLRAEYDFKLMGLSSVGDETWRRRWEEQIVELKKRSVRRMAQNEGSWGRRMRARNRN